MISLHPQFVVDEKTRRTSVMLSLQEWEDILERLEEMDAIEAYDAARSASEDSIPFEEAVREIKV